MAKSHPENGAAELLRRPVRVPWACVFALALTLALVNARPACASSPTATLEAFFGRANTILASVDPERGLEEPRQAIRDLVNEVFEFRGAGALVLGSVWLSRAPDDQDEFLRLFANVLERGFVAAISSTGSVVAPVADARAAPRVPETRQELHLTVFPSEVKSSERPRASVKAEESAVRKQVGPARQSQPTRPSYWIQVGAFQTVEAAIELAKRFRHDGATISKSWLTNAAGKRVGVWARVRVGPFANRSEAVAKLRDL